MNLEPVAAHGTGTLGNSLPFTRTCATISPTDIVPSPSGPMTERPLTSVHRHRIVGHKEQRMAGRRAWPNTRSTGRQENDLGKSESRIGSQSGQCMTWSGRRRIFTRPNISSIHLQKSSCRNSESGIGNG
ncbi:hypothetical protein ALQ68_200139 [Pseudomonas savastanoi pv. glycinea]|nr:hypothetical protein ALQ68_200139 [Pseudomonas savastanoi pv. glycinea]